MLSTMARYFVNVKHCCEAITYLLPRVTSKLQFDCNPQVVQYLPSGPISISFPFWMRNAIMGSTAEDWAFIARLISERLKPHSLFSSKATN
jgi:hypothetical protein